MKRGVDEGEDRIETALSPSTLQAASRLLLQLHAASPSGHPHPHRLPACSCRPPSPPPPLPLLRVCDHPGINCPHWWFPGVVGLGCGPAQKQGCRPELFWFWREGELVGRQRQGGSLELERGHGLSSLAVVARASSPPLRSATLLLSQARLQEDDDDEGLANLRPGWRP